MRLVVPALAALVLSGCGGTVVVRVVDGRPAPGRFIAEQAYALYGYGAEAEARGDLAGAQRAFATATEYDPDSPEIWTRLGAVRCRQAPAGAPPPPAALGDFERAAQADPAFAPLFRERARCDLAHGRAAQALVAAERAVALDPGDTAAAVARAEALERVGLVDEARRALAALTTQRPAATQAWRATLALAQRTGDAALAREAAAHAGAPDGVTPPQPATRVAEARAALAGVDAALAAGDLEGARRLAHRARLPWSELAVRAAALGRAAEARQQAELVLGADPADAGARIARVAAEGGGDAAALRGIPARERIASPLARLVYAELLARRTGVEAARAWLGPIAEAAPEEDPLLATTAARVKALLLAP
jgi:tetratricopeptide (TPR) repeat protein